MLADWFRQQFSTGVLIVPCMLTLAIPGVLPRFKAEQMMPAIALIVSVIASVVIGGRESGVPAASLIWCAVRYTPQVTCLLTFVTGAVEIVLVANSVIDISVSCAVLHSGNVLHRLGIATMAICPIMVSFFSVAAINSLMKQVALRADLIF